MAQNGRRIQPLERGRHRGGAEGQPVGL